jgi:glycosyltransferase involved in cell wall biosynthesis
MKISIITPTYNSEKTIGRFIDSLLLQTKLPDEIIIADGNSTDKTKEICESFRNPIIKFIVNNKNHYCGTNKNLGARFVKNDFLLIIDSDVVADEKLVENYSKEFKDHPIIAGNVKVLNPGRVSNFAYLEEKSLMPKESGFICKNFFWAINFGITKNEFIGFPDSPSVEDLVLITNLRKKKAKIWFCDSAIVFHPYPETLFAYFNKKMFYAKGVIEQKDQIETSKQDIWMYLMKIYDKKLEELENAIKNKSVAFDPAFGIIFDGKPNKEFLMQNIASLALVVAAYEKKGGVLGKPYKEIFDDYCKTNDILI